METLEQKTDEERSSMKTVVVDGSVKKKTKLVSFPMETVEDIVSRLPVESILRSRSVSKPWLSLISNPSFNKLQFTRATESHRTGFFISAYDDSTNKRYYLTAAKDGGPLTLLMTVDKDFDLGFTGPSHLNGLMCFTSNTLKSNGRGINYHASVVNPSTRKIFQIPDMNFGSGKAHSGYLYGFDESRNEHKILYIKKVYKTDTFKFMIFSMSSYSWRKIDVETPVGIDWERLHGGLGGGVCVNSVVHLLLQDISYDILAFDFVTEKFSVISLPQGVMPPGVNLDANVGPIKIYRPAITKIDGCLAVFLHNLKRSQIHIWLLKDYDNRVWVKETIELPKSWNMTIHGFPLSIDVNMDDEIVFNVSKVTENRVTVPVYNRKLKCFKTLEFNLDGEFASATFNHIKCYVETIMPLSDNWSKTSHGQSDQMH